jgi:hypothetical protein
VNKQFDSVAWLAGRRSADGFCSPLSEALLRPARSNHSVVNIMTGSTLQLKSLSTLEHSWSQAKDVGKTQVAQRRERSQLNLMSFMASMVAAIAYTFVSLAIAVIAIVALVLVAPWLLLAPMIAVGLLINLAGFVFAGLGLI